MCMTNVHMHALSENVIGSARIACLRLRHGANRQKMKGTNKARENTRADKG